MKYVSDSIDTGVAGAEQEPLDLQLGSGLTALVGGDGLLRSEIMERFARRLAQDDERLQTLIAGPGPVGPALAWRRAVRILRSGRASRASTRRRLP